MSDFDKLHSRKAEASAALLAFDVLQLDGNDLRALPLVERKLRLRKLLARRSDGFQLVEFLEGDGATIFAHACRLGLEGIVCKRADVLTMRDRSAIDEDWYLGMGEYLQSFAPQDNC